MAVHQRFPDLSAEPLWRLRPREKRYGLQAETMIITADGLLGPGAVLNLSNKGCRIRTHLALRQGDRLRLTLEPLGRIEAEVRWIIGDEAGLRLIAREAHFRDYVQYVMP